MKRILLILLAFMLVSSSAYADDALLSAITTDSEFTAFTSDDDSSLDGWKGYTKNSDLSIDAQSWYTFRATKRIVGNVIANMPESLQDVSGSSPSASVFYTNCNFGSEYNFSGDFYNFQNQSYVYFNASVAENNGTVLANGGYRIVADRAKKRIELQKYYGSSWISLAGEDTGAWGWILCHFDITFADGAITARVTHGDKFDITLSCDVSADEDYADTGFIGFGSAAAKMTVAKINVKYNSSKVYSMPTLREAGELFDGYYVLPAEKENTFKVWMDMADDADVASCNLYIDNALYGKMSQSGDEFSIGAVIADKGTHTTKVVMTDRYGNEAELVSNTFFVSDHYASPALFTDSEGNVLTSAAGATGAVDVSFDFNPCGKSLSAVTVYAVKYDESGKMTGIYPNKILNPEKNTETELKVTVDSVSSGEWITAILFEDYSKPSPLSGGFMLK